ncbi:MAG: 23S rRNA (pseudouridine(1915)-N(3))-methyltransferase RlmH [Burkholderiales bacterium]|nr:23S rRNA (pseudouridine(1915)-N(3))-methyltransferase RlmH [Burkholderiales bacterium]
MPKKSHSRETSRLVCKLAALTLPHAMAKVLLLEQIYRSAAIASNHPYHRD